MKVASLIREKTGYIISPDAMFDVQVYFLTENIEEPIELVLKYIFLDVRF
jgi:hypothetical protein